MGTYALHRSARTTLGRLARARSDNDVLRWEAAEVLGDRNSLFSNTSRSDRTVDDRDLTQLSTRFEAYIRERVDLAVNLHARITSRRKPGMARAEDFNVFFSVYVSDRIKNAVGRGRAPAGAVSIMLYP
jgi:hypothetical protein